MHANLAQATRAEKSPIFGPDSGQGVLFLCSNLRKGWYLVCVCQVCTNIYQLFCTIISNIRVKSKVLMFLQLFSSSASRCHVAPRRGFGVDADQLPPAHLHQRQLVPDGVEPRPARHVSHPGRHLRRGSVSLLCRCVFLCL